MGYAITRTDLLMRTVEAVAGGLAAMGHAVDAPAAVRAFLGALQAEAVRRA
jgi:hypothetical protein